MKARIRKNDYQHKDEKGNPYLKAAIIKTIDIQIAANDPPETKQTFDRLVAAGYTEQQAKEKIGVVLGYILYNFLQDKKKFDREKYVNDLLEIK